MASRPNNRKQRARRRAGERFRLELQIDTTDPAGLALVEFLANDVPKGHVSAFVRAAIQEKIDRETGQGARYRAPQAAQEARHGSIESDAVLALAREVKRLQGLVARGESYVTPGTRESTKPTMPEHQAEQSSSGIDMSAPRRGGRLKATAPTVNNLTVEPPAQNPALLLAASIRAASAQLAAR